MQLVSEPTDQELLCDALAKQMGETGFAGIVMIVKDGKILFRRVNLGAGFAVDILTDTRSAIIKEL